MALFGFDSQDIKTMINRLPRLIATLAAAASIGWKPAGNGLRPGTESRYRTKSLRLQDRYLGLLDIFKQ